MAIFKPSALTIALTTAGCVFSTMPSYAWANESASNQQATAAQTEKSEQTQQSNKTDKSDETKKNSQENTNAEQSVQNENTESNSVANESAQATEKEDNKLVITGSYSGSLIRSLEEKRNADTVSEQLSADDIGSLPDVSIADALTRLPGISAIRTGGQAAEINIRGLSGIFIHSTLNGREQVSTSGTRSVDFDQYPSELIASGSVYKSQKASLIEGGVAGSIELRTVSPLANAEQHKFNLNARAMYNDRASSVHDADQLGERLSFSYQGKFANDTIGVALGFARLNQPSVAEQFIGLTYPTTLDLDGIAGDTDLGADADCPECELISEGMELQHKGGKETRDGYVAAFEWVPNSDFILKLDAFSSKFDSEQWARGLRVKFGGSAANYYFPRITDNTMVGGVVARTTDSFTRVEIANDDDTEIDEVNSYGAKAEWQLTSAFNFKADLSHSKGTSDFQNRLLWSGLAEDASLANPVFDENVVINYQYSGLDIPSVGFNQDFTDLNSVMAAKYGTYPYLYDDTVNALRLDGTYELFDNNILSSFEFGVRYSERRYDSTRKVFEYGNEEFSSIEAPFQLQPGMASVVHWQGDFAHFPSYLALDIDQVLASWLPNGVGTPVTTFGTNLQGELDYSTDWSVRQSGSVFEDVTAAYFLGNIDTYLFDIPVTGNVGVRMVNTEQSATRLRAVDESLPLEQRLALGAEYIVDEAGLTSFRFARDEDGIDYTDFLPSFNLNFKLTEDSQLRFAAARVMARPEINRLAADFSGSIDDNPNRTPENPEVKVYNASQTNNPRLKPFMADQYDLSWEHYYADGTGGFSVAVFYKNIKNFVDTITIENFDFAAAGIPTPETYIDPQSLVEYEVGNGNFTYAFNNDEGGSIHGFELATTTVFDFLPDFWSGLGVNASYAYTDSAVKTLTETGQIKGEISFEGLSRHVANATLFYSYDGFETRLSTRYRSEFVSRQWGVNEQVVYFDDETVFDYQASYDVNDNTRLLFQINNLTDQPTKSYFVSESRTGTIQYFGRQMFLGVNYSL